MKISYHSTFNEKKNLKRFYATLSAWIEQPDVNQDIYLYISFRTESGYWDIARCHVKYDGVVNMPYRSYRVTDHFSENKPFNGGLDDKLPKDKYQDWVINKEGSYSDCPGFPEKCLFVCNIARNYKTGWADDYNMNLIGPLSLNVAYMVYD